MNTFGTSSEPKIYQELPAWAQRAFQKMFDMVEKFHPDVIILTARKMPRICEGFQICFGSRAVIISDLAIPFSSECLANARVAIIDDVVNIGSTLGQIAGTVERYFPAEIRLFSLAKRNSTPDIRETCYAHPSALVEHEYQSYVRTIPAVIGHVCKPYDLTFPIIQARYRIPYRSGAEIVHLLREEFNDRAVHTIPTPYANSPVRRVSLIVSTDKTPFHQKIRLFFNDSTSSCSIVPMVIPSCIGDQKLALKLPWVANVRDQLTDSLHKETELSVESKAAVTVFTSSLDWFWSGEIYARLQSLFEFDSNSFSFEDAKMVFGLAIERVSPNFDQGTIEAPVTGIESKISNSKITSPFFEKFPKDDLIESARKRLPKDGQSESEIDTYSNLLALIDSLAEMVGAQNPKEYNVEWPYSKAEVSQNPYLRLRIGPTFPDILAMCMELHGLITGAKSAPSGLSEHLSLTLDALIDQGAIVPTFAKYDGKIFRIYRRGEAPGQDVCDKVLFALAEHGEDVSITRLAKILSALSHSQKYNSILKSSARARGLVGSSPKTVLGAEPENIATYLRNTGQIRIPKT